MNENLAPRLASRAKLRKDPTTGGWILLFPEGLLKLNESAAAILRRSVVFMVGLYRGGNQYHVVFAPIADFSTVAPKARDAAVRDAVERYAALLDQYCRCDPYNWFNFFDFWREPNCKPEEPV